MAALGKTLDEFFQSKLRRLRATGKSTIDIRHLMIPPRNLRNGLMLHVGQFFQLIDRPVNFPMMLGINPDLCQASWEN